MEKEVKSTQSVKRRGELRLPARASFYYVISAVIGRSAGILLTPIFTRIIDTSEYGYFSYYISVLSIVSLLSSIFLSPSVIYSGLGKFKNEKAEFENASTMLSVIIIPVICLVLFTFNGVFKLDKDIIIFMTIQIFLDSIVTVELLSGKFFYDYTRVVTINLLSSFLAPIISLFLIFIFGMGALGRIYGLLISGAVIASILLIKRATKLAIPRPEHISFLLSNSLPLLPGIMARAVMGWSDKLVIKSYLGIEALAKYSVAHTVGMALFGIIGALTSALNPWIIRKLTTGDKGSLFAVIKNLSELISYGSIFVVGLAPEILSLLAPKSYADSLYAILPLAISTAPFFLFGVISVFLTFIERTKFISLFTVTGALLNLALNLILIKGLGYIGGGISYLLAESLIFLLATSYVKKQDGFKEINFMGLGLSALFSAVFSLILATLFPYPSLRLIALIPPACLAINRGFCCLELSKEK